MTGAEKQALLGCAILALGVAFSGNLIIVGETVLHFGASLKIAGSVILADYALDRILLAWRTKPK